MAKDGTRQGAGVSTHTVYLLLKAPVQRLMPNGPAVPNVPPPHRVGKRGPEPVLYLTSVDAAATAAQGASSPQSVFSAIFRNQFASRRIYVRVLDPRSGSVTAPTDPPHLMTYYTSIGSQDVQPWQWPQALNGFPLNNCFTLMPNRFGTCDTWARWLADETALNGIQSLVEPVGRDPKFTFASGLRGPVNDREMLMLIHQWLFPLLGGPTSTATFNLVGGNVLGPLGAAGFAGSDAQGQPYASPPGWFRVGGHALVVYPPTDHGELYDPSYGTGPFRSIADWAHASVDGWASLHNTSSPSGCRSRSWLETSPTVSNPAPCAPSRSPGPLGAERRTQATGHRHNRRRSRRSPRCRGLCKADARTRIRRRLAPSHCGWRQGGVWTTSTSCLR